MTPEAPWEGALRRLEGILARVEALLGKREAPPPDTAIFHAHRAFRWERNRRGGRTDRSHPPPAPGRSRLSRRDRRGEGGTPPEHGAVRFGAGGEPRPSLGGARHREVVVREGAAPRLRSAGPADRGARPVGPVRLPKIVGQLRDLPFRFLLFCDDLSFDEGRPTSGGSRRCWTAAWRSAGERADLRHLEPAAPDARTPGRAGRGGRDPSGGAVSEKLSLSDRFGLQLGFYRFDQETYLAVVETYAGRMRLPVDPAALREEALRWALSAGSRSGRTAKQFIDDLAGRLGMRSP